MQIVNIDAAKTQLSALIEQVEAGEEIIIARAGRPVASRVGELPLHHRNPFDRLLLTQAILGPYQFYTSDRKLPAYSPLVTLVGSFRPSL